jgi:hypothetical protein
MKPANCNVHPRVLFSRYHISDVSTVMKGISESGLADHFWIENPGKDQNGVVQPNSITIYTDLIRPDAEECAQAYKRFQLTHRIGLNISIKA